MKKGFSTFELTIAIIIIFILTGLLAISFSRLAVDAKEVVLLEELNSLRSSVRLYQLINNKYPSTLKVLIQENYKLPGQGKRNFFAPASLDKEQNILDPFGKPYLYLKETGQVFCTHEEYKIW